MRAIYYQAKKPSIRKKLQKKLGIEKPASCLSEIFSFDPQNGTLDDVRALWLTSSIVLSKAETEELLTTLPRLQWVYSQRSGTDHLSLDCYKNRGVLVSTTGNLVAAWVAQMNLACILSHAKRIPLHIDRQRRREPGPLFCDDIADQTVVILGTGNIGVETARLCQAIGMRVVGLSRNPSRIDTSAHFDAICDIRADINQTLTEADYLVVALPQTQETLSLINSARLALMKRSACLVNLARPPIVDENALLYCLKMGNLAAAYVSGLQNVSRIGNLRVSRLSNLVITHYSDAHLRKKNVLAFKQFLANLEHLRNGDDVESRIV